MKSNFADWRLRLQTTSLGSRNNRARHFAELGTYCKLLLTAMGRPLARSDKYRDSAMGAGYSLRSIPTLHTLLAAEELFFLMNRDHGVPWEVIRKIREAWWVGCDGPCPFQRLCQP